MASYPAIARRNAVAANRTKDATQRIATALGIDLVPIEGANRGGAAFKQLSEREAVTENLGRIADALEGRGAAGDSTPEPPPVTVPDSVELKPRRQRRESTDAIDC